MSQYKLGTDAPWYEGRALTEEEREVFRARSQRSHRAKLHALAGSAVPAHPENVPAYDPGALMPTLNAHGLSALSLFSGGGGLDLGFDRAGYAHVASYDTLEAAGVTLSKNRPAWFEIVLQAQHRGHDAAGLGAGNADHPDATATGWRGNGDDGVVEIHT